MSRHNRRRTRSGPKIFTSSQCDACEPPSCTVPLESKPPNTRHPRRGDLSAKTWHNRYHVWQARERKQKEECERLEEDRKRIFGGDGNDDEDDGLCSRMMDYFVRLDYLEG